MKSGRFFEYCDKLQGGLLVEQSEGQSLWLPPACPHATFSEEPSMLVGQELTFREDFHHVITCLPASLTQEAASTVWTRFSRGLEESLWTHYQSEIPIIRAWIAKQEFFEQHSKDIPQNITRRLRQCWSSYLQVSTVEKCPHCQSNQPESTFAMHFQNVHLSYFSST